MKKIGFVDYYLSEWHANNYPAWIERIAAEMGCDAILGCDAHYPQMLTDTPVIERGRQYAERFGLHLIGELPIRDPRCALKT